MSSSFSNSSLFADIAESAPEERITLAVLFRRLEGDSLAIAILVLGVAGIAPGLSVLAGALLAICAAQLIVGGESVFLPRFISERSLSAARITRILGDAQLVLRHVEQRKRSDRPLPAYVKRAAGIPILALSLTLFVPIPLSNIVPAGIIVALALGCLADDALLLCSAALGSVVSLAITVAAVGALIGVGNALI